MVFLHHSQVISHLFCLLGSQGRQIGAFLGSVFGRPLGKFPGFSVVLSCIQVRLLPLFQHGIAAILEISYLEPGSNKNNASNRTPNFLVGGQSPKLLQHILIVACVYLFIRSVVQRIVSYCILIRFLYCIIYINVCRVVNGTSSKCSIVFQGFEDIGVVVNWIASLRFEA